ncbi:hypothetical protein TVAG_238660 [Trichomonas vaginalis G3]|uniref:Transmembrane protein n=1 Tax=Trichomonas vaginalis (strain ATCC PRA-98 / G3) TaxID=412133 RepID=A2DG98_TRIV3|nr:hypothetical protein TVAGG3_0967360 [Trichomonas vaginalis G3]EAY20494.1 hypothetical protein TVAG_238660 [Trichomonas vaginalis G3]KAI5488337.1 hypothetical protein TVAGG3_0967360 [Trichomonas vaginalis G3]|eukprot:XP_001581480.1 hypothetical protein [Trichomonas vaginalis G3]
MEKAPNKRVSKEVKEDVNRIEQLKLKFIVIRMWFTCGETPPQSVKITIFGVLALIFAAFKVGTNCYKSIRYLDHKTPQNYALLVTTIFIVVPSLYILFISFCCWRRIAGYDWWMIPHLT